ncbi:hypothetical protein EDC04DRAFT_2664119, partial [Pisolithus marmoratus]
RCPSLRLSGEIVTGILQVIGGVIMLFRVYLFYNKDRRVLSLLVAVAVICVGIWCWTLLLHSSSTSQQFSAA